MGMHANTPAREVYQPAVAIGATKSLLRHRLLFLVIGLIASGIAFCIIVAYQRDTRVREESLEWAAKVQSGLQSYFDQRGFLPPVPPKTDAGRNGALSIRYPTPDELMKIPNLSEPIAVLATHRVGLILLEDGYAAIILDGRHVRAAWMTEGEITAAKARRAEMLRPGGP
jgi:hypothetical protein